MQLSLCQLTPIDPNEATAEAIGDWNSWLT
jgi:hypothetical protein